MSRGSRSMDARRWDGRRWRYRQRGWAATEYLSVLVGLMVVWWGAKRALTLVQEHHDEFTWALMMPF